MTEILDMPLLGLTDSIPDTLFLLAHPSTGKFGCYCHAGVHGLACFSTEGGAFRFAEFINLSGMSSKEVSFDEARDIAKDRPLPIISLMLLDKIAEPVIHYVR